MPWKGRSVGAVTETEAGREDVPASPGRRRCRLAAGGHADLVIASGGSRDYLTGSQRAGGVGYRHLRRCRDARGIEGALDLSPPPARNRDDRRLPVASDSEPREHEPSAQDDDVATVRDLIDAREPAAKRSKPSHQLPVSDLDVAATVGVVHRDADNKALPHQGTYCRLERSRGQREHIFGAQRPRAGRPSSLLPAGATTGTSALLRDGIPMNPVAPDRSPAAACRVDVEIAGIEVVVVKATLDEPAAEGVVGIAHGQEVHDRYEVVRALCPVRTD